MAQTPQVGGAQMSARAALAALIFVFQIGIDSGMTVEASISIPFASKAHSADDITPIAISDFSPNDPIKFASLDLPP